MNKENALKFTIDRIECISQQTFITESERKIVKEH